MATTPTFRHAVKWAYLMTWGQCGIALLLTFTLAAILDPGDFGTVAMAAAFILFIELLVAQGMTAAIIQRKDLDRLHLDSVFWMLLGGSVALGGASIALSPWWAPVNRLPELAPVISVLSLSIPIRGLTVVQHAVLQREMAFRKLALISCVASTVGGILGVTMALAGCGVWSLVTQQLTTSALAMAAMWLASDWRPRLLAPRVDLDWQLSLPRFGWKVTPQRFAACPHYREIGFAGTGDRVVRQAIRQAGWWIADSRRVSELPWHHFFYCRKPQPPSSGPTPPERGGSS